MLGHSMAVGKKEPYIQNNENEVRFRLLANGSVGCVKELCFDILIYTVLVDMLSTNLVFCMGHVKSNVNCATRCSATHYGPQPIFNGTLFKF